MLGSSGQPASVFSSTAMEGPQQKVGRYQERETLEFTFESELRAAEQHKRASSLDRQLLKAVARKSVRSVAKYLKLGADPNAVSRNYGTAVENAVVSGSVEVLQLLLSAGADASPVNLLKQTPLHLACMIPHTGLISTLLRGGADPNMSSQPRSALHYAIARGSESAVKLLIEAGADVNAMGMLDSSWGLLSPLGRAFQHKHWRTFVPILLDAGAKTDQIYWKSMDSGLLEAALLLKCDPELIQYLIKNGRVPTVAEMEVGTTSHSQPRSLVAMLIKYYLDGVCNVDQVKVFFRMLTAAGYDMKADSVCQHIAVYCTQVRRAILISSSAEGSPDSVTGLSIENFEEAYFQEWQGPNIISEEKTRMLVGCYKELFREFSKPLEVPRLANLCRDRVRSRLTRVRQESLLQDLIADFPVPYLIKKFLMMDEFVFNYSL